MDLLTNEPKIEDDKNRKLMKLILVIVGILVVISIILVCLIMYMQSSVLKVSINGTTTTVGGTNGIREDIFVFEDGKNRFICCEDSVRREEIIEITKNGAEQ